MNEDSITESLETLAARQKDILILLKTILLNLAAQSPVPPELLDM